MPEGGGFENYMKTIKIIHAADLHLDSAFEALGAAKAAQRRAEQRQMLLKIFSLVEEKGAQLLLLAGDTFDYSNHAYAETLELLRSCLKNCPARVFVSPGNHDSWRASSPWATGNFSENVHIFSSGCISRVELPELGLRIYGSAFTDSIAPPPLRGFRAEKAQGIFNIGLFHGDTRSPDSRYGAITQSDIAESGLDYLALGHVHNRSELCRSGGTWWAYPGCTEGRGFDECGEKGVYYVELSEEGCTAEFIPTCQRQYRVLDIDIGGDILSQLPPDTERDICRLILRGECLRSPDLRALEEQLSPRFFALQIKDATRLTRDIWEGSAADSLRGLFLRKMRKKYDRAADEAQRQQIIRATRWGLAALEDGEAVEQL